MGVACDRHGRQRCAAVARRQRYAAVARRNEAGGRGYDEREKHPPHGYEIRHERAELAVFRKFVRAPLNLELAR